MFCRKCGRQASEGAAFCQNCGTAFAVNAQAVVQEKVILEDKPYLTVKEFVNSPYGAAVKKNYNWICVLSWLGQIFTLLVFGGAVAIMFYLINTGEVVPPPGLPIGTFVATLLSTAVFGLPFFGKVRKDFKNGSAVLTIVGGFFFLLGWGLILGIVIYNNAKKLNKAYNTYLYT